MAGDHEDALSFWRRRYVYLEPGRPWLIELGPGTTRDRGLFGYGWWKPYDILTFDPIVPSPARTDDGSVVFDLSLIGTKGRRPWSRVQGPAR